MRRPLLALFLPLVALAACQQADLIAVEPRPDPQQKAPPKQDPPWQAKDLCRALVAAPPALWQKRWPAVRALGRKAVPALLDAIRHDPLGPGAQAGIQLLGEFGGDAARGFLEAELGRGTSLAEEAALSLGRIADPRSEAPLRKTLGDKTSAITTRAAAAAALIDLGKAKSILPFLRAVFLAATPYRGDSTRKQGLPRKKVRWAHERYMLIEALRRRYEGKTFGFDEDLSWPALRNATAKLSAFLAKPR